MSESKGLSLAYPIGELQKGGCGGREHMLAGGKIG